MRRGMTAALLAAATAVALGQPAQANSDVAAAVAAGVVGVAVGASLAKHSHHSHSHSNKRHFSPEPGITCYDHQRACYHDGGGFASNWTWRIYG